MHRNLALLIALVANAIPAFDHTHARWTRV
ncbi:MAG: hypothetical protein RL173_994, partial [Fibrobacterota bacterium]